MKENILARRFVVVIIVFFLFSFLSLIQKTFAQTSATPTLSPTIDPCRLQEFCPTPTPTDTPTTPPTPTPGPTSTPATGPTSTPGPRPTNTPSPTPTPKPKPTVGFFQPVADTPTQEPSVTPTATPTPKPTPTPIDKPNFRSAFVRSILAPNEIPISGKFLLLSVAISAFMVLLLVFPSELFNSTVQSNYDEIIKWRIVRQIRSLYEGVNKLPALIVVIGFAILGAVIDSFLSPDFGFNKSTISLVVGMLLALAIISTVYDVSRSFYMKKRFGRESKLRAHSLGLVTGSILVAVSRFSNFLPGYCYGIFTALVFNDEIGDRENGEGLAFGAGSLLVVGIIGWFAWVPIKQIATGANPSLWALVIDAAFSSLWVSMLTGTVFGLLPMSFMYGETIKKWNSKVWAVLYFTGVFLFVYTILNPAVGIYGTSDKVSWIAVLGLFFAFGIFSFGFWGYFRYRPLWHKAKK